MRRYENAERRLSHGTIRYFRAQNEVTDALTDVAFALKNLSDADWSRAGVPTKGDIAQYLASDVTKLAFVWIMLPPKDKDAIRRAVDLHIKPVFRRGAEMLRMLTIEDVGPSEIVT